MSSDADDGHKAPEAGGGDETSENADIDQLQADIAQTRQDLGETVDALTAKLDVKTRAKEQVHVVRQRAIGQLDAARSRATDVRARARSAAVNDDGKLEPVVPAGAAALAVVGVALLLLWRRRGR